MSGRPLDHIHPERLWYTQITALEVAAELAAETGIRQRVKRIDRSTNSLFCEWLIEEI